MSCMQDTSHRCAEYWFKSRAMEHTSKKERRQLQLHSYHGLVAKLTYHVILLLSMLFLFFRIWHYCCHELHAGRIASLCRILVEARAMKRIKKKKTPVLCKSLARQRAHFHAGNSDSLQGDGDKHNSMRTYNIKSPSTETSPSLSTKREQLPPLLDVRGES